MLIFDVDGTVVESCQRMTWEMTKAIKAIPTPKVFISGTDMSNLRAMLSSIIMDDQVTLLPLNGAECWFRGVLRYRTLPSFQPEEAEEIRRAVFGLMASFGIKPVADDVFQDRGPQLTFSLLGRSAPSVQKALFDQGMVLRQAIVDQLKSRFEDRDYSYAIGGTTSIDISSAKWDKGDGLRMLFFRYPGMAGMRPIFFGDHITDGGNDAPAALAVTALSGTYHQVSGPEETLALLRGMV